MRSEQFQENIHEHAMHDHGAGAAAIVAKVDGEPVQHTEARELALILGQVFRSCVTTPEDLRGTAIRLLMLSLILCPDFMGAPSMAKIGRVFGVTRQALSKINLYLQKKFNLRYRPSKLSTTRLNYRKAQLLAVKRGNHASQVVRQRKRQKRGKRSGRRKEWQDRAG